MDVKGKVKSLTELFVDMSKYQFSDIYTASKKKHLGHF